MRRRDLFVIDYYIKSINPTIINQTNVDIRHCRGQLQAPTCLPCSRCARHYGRVAERHPTPPRQRRWSPGGNRDPVPLEEARLSSTFKLEVIMQAMPSREITMCEDMKLLVQL